MALHMVDDPQGQDDYVDDNSGNNDRGGGGGMNLGGLLSFLPIVFSLFRGRGGSNAGRPGGGGGCSIKTILILAAIGALLYFFVFKGGCGGGGSVANNGNNRFSETGYNFDANETRKAQVYEGLEDDNTKNPLPEMVSLSKFAPPRQDQGKQGSCVAWSSAYAARTILEAASTKGDPTALAYSPAFLYNNIALEDCQGSYIQKAMEFMQANGAVRYNDFKYDERDCSRSTNNSSLIQQGQQNKIHGFHRLTETDDVNGINIRAIKEHLAKDAPVVIGMMVGGSFMEEMLGQKVWHPTRSDKNMTGFGGHAMCVVGYDDRVEGGAFEIMNSWGAKWGQNGIGYVRYGDFKEFTREAYGLDPLPKRGAALSQAFEANVGLFNPETRSNVALRLAGTNIFKTVTPIKKGSKFKIEIKNAVECYIYIFTPDSLGRSTVLFPYKAAHSPYCGITGYRLFPRKESIMADAVGVKEEMAVVISKTQQDYKALNARIAASPGADFAAKVNNAIAADAMTNMSYGNTSNGMMYFKSNGGVKNIIACIVQIDKQ